jgi:hypothetical protein
MDSRERIHHLVDELPEEDMATIKRILEGLVAASRNPVLRALQEADYDDEEIDSEEEREVVAALDDLKRGKVCSTEEARKRLDL